MIIQDRVEVKKRFSSLGCFLVIGGGLFIFGLLMILKAATTETGGDIANAYWGGIGFISLVIGGIFLIGALLTWISGFIYRKPSD